MTKKDLAKRLWDISEELYDLHKEAIPELEKEGPLHPYILKTLKKAEKDISWCVGLACPEFEGEGDTL